MNPVDAEVVVDHALVEPLRFSLVLELVIIDVTENRFEFSRRPIRELIVPSDPALSGGIVLVDEVIHEVEIPRTRVELCNIGDLTALLGQEREIVEMSGHLSVLLSI